MRIPLGLRLTAGASQTMCPVSGPAFIREPGSSLCLIRSAQRSYLVNSQNVASVMTQANENKGGNDDFL
jgi:hypothetical protein